MIRSVLSVLCIRPAFVALVFACVSLPAFAQYAYANVSSRWGLDGVRAEFVQLADLNGDGYPDLVVDARRVFLNTPNGPDGSRAFEPVADPGIPVFENGLFDQALSTAFADFDGDRILDCLWVPYAVPMIKGYNVPEGLPDGVCWLKGNGDGTFGVPRRIAVVRPKAHNVIAIADVDRDGLLDFYLGASYIQAGWWRDRWTDPNGTDEGYTGDLVLQRRTESGEISWKRIPLPEDSGEYAVPSSPENDEHDLGTAPSLHILDEGGRPTFGALIASLDGTGRQAILECNYGRRGNRVWFSPAPDIEAFRDIAGTIGLDGDAVRHGVYPAWTHDHPTLGRFTREPELPYRVHGNTFDAQVADIDRDGDMDLFLAQIRHGWAGSSSDPTALWMNHQGPGAEPEFVLQDPEGTIGRAPGDPSVMAWNEGDLFSDVLDIDHDGRLDLVLSSGDYPDNQKLRIFRQQTDGTFSDITDWIGLWHEGSQMISIADLDQDGWPEIVAGQRFMRYERARIAGRQPAIGVFMNSSAHRGGSLPGGSSITIQPRFSERSGANHFGIGAIVRCVAVIDGERVTQTRQLTAIGGRNGKQHGFSVHFGLGDAESAELVEVIAPNHELSTFRFEGLRAGTHRLLIGD